jgi:hypothetical protein
MVVDFLDRRQSTTGEAFSFLLQSIRFERLARPAYWNNQLEQAEGPLPEFLL